MADPLQSNPSFGLPPEIPTGTSTPVPDAVSTPTPTPPPLQTPTPAPAETRVFNNIILPEHKTAPGVTPKQTLIDVLGPEAVSDSTPAPLRAEDPRGMGMPKPAPAPAPASEQTLPRVDEPPFERAVPIKEVAVGIPVEHTQPKPIIEEKPVAPQPRVETQPIQKAPAEPTPLQESVSAMDRVTDAVRRASIRTLESDAAETIQKKNMSVSSIALAEQTRADKTVRDVLPEEKSHTLPWVLGGVGLAVLGVIVVTLAYLMQTQSPTTPVVVTAENALIPGVEETTLDVTDMTRTKLSQTLSALPSAYTENEGISLVRLVTYVDETDADGKIERVVKDMMPEDFFQTLSARNTDRLERSLGKLTYFGIVSQGGKTAPFIALEVTSYESAFAGLLEWEPALPEDISFMVAAPAPLPTQPEPVLPTATTSTSTLPSNTSSSTTATTTKPTVITVNSSPVPIFRDISIKNKDVRAYVDGAGTLRILYSFLSQKLLIIAQDEETLTAIIDYISTARFTR